MNKQEAIEKIKNLYSFIMEDGPFEVGLINKNQVLDIISKIDEHQKVTIPKFVAEWIKSQKKSFSDVSAIDMYDNLTLDNNGGYYHDVWLWVIDHQYDFIKAWHDGYDVEKEKLYTVDIPNPHSYIDNHSRLARNYKGKVVLEVQDWLNTFESYKLTESEIKQDFDWAWKWAKEVENDTEN